MLYPATDVLESDAWNYFQEGREQEAFDDYAEDVIECCLVELDGMNLQEVEE